MKLYRNIKFSLNALLINRSRTLFSILGMAVGIASVVVTVAIGDGAKKKAVEEIEQMGSNVIIVNASKASVIPGRVKQIPIVNTLVSDDVEAIKTSNYIVEASPFIENQLRIKNGNVSVMSSVQGVSENYYKIRDFDISLGRMFSGNEKELSKRVAVLGATPAMNIFGNENPIGEIIYVKKIPFEVIGVLKAKGMTAEAANQDDVILIPEKTAMRRVYNVDFLSKIYVKVDYKENLVKAEKDIVNILSERHKLKQYNQENDFEISNQINALKASRETAKTFTFLILGVAAISLIIGGTGILAVMILSVKERINEIGLRISVGARKVNIVIQFLIEALILGLSGGIFGIIVGCIAALMINHSSDWTTEISLNAIFISFSFSLFTGLLFGVFPASKAAKLDPIKALKDE